MWVELAFTASSPNNYKVLTNYNDRNMAREEFTFVPDTGASDPYAPYSRLFQVQGGSFNFKQEPLSETPVVLRFHLNQWVRFDQPGEYRVSVVSPRLAVRPKSNEIVLHIVQADPQWQGEELARIRKVLDANPPSIYPETPVREAALRALCDLGTEDAAREMVRRLPGDERGFWTYGPGLVRSSNRAEGVREMERMLQDPDAPVTQLFLDVMAKVSIDPTSDPAEMVRKSEANRAILQRKSVAALPFKRGAALAASAATILGFRDLPDDDRKRAAGILIERFADLPAEMQSSYLSTRSLFTREQQLSIYRIVFERGDAGQGPLFAGIALGRWYAMDPVNARAAMIAEMQRPKPRFGERFLGFLPDKSLPQVEAELARHLVAGTTLATQADIESQVHLAELLHRYATAAALPTVLPFLNGPRVCEAENSVLAYVLKVDPATARPLIQRALSGARPQSCALLSGIGLDANPFLEELALSRLNDPSHRVALDAAGYLGRRGSSASEAYLLARYENWTRNTKFSADEMNFGSSLVAALAQGQAWLYDAVKLRSTADRAPTGPVRQRWEEELRHWSGELFVSPETNTPGRYDVAQYRYLTLDELKQKLVQFPRGAKFRWSEQDPSADPGPAFRDLAQWAVDKGISIVR